MLRWREAASPYSGQDEEEGTGLPSVWLSTGSRLYFNRSGSTKETSFYFLFEISRMTRPMSLSSTPPMRLEVVCSHSPIILS